MAAMREIISDQYRFLWENWIYIGFSTYTYTEDCDEPIYRRNLKTCNTCKVTRSKECHIKEDHLENTTY